MNQRNSIVVLLCILSGLSPCAAANGNDSKDAGCTDQITYQSEKDDAYRYLEDRQREIYTENPQLTDPFSREELNKPRAVATFEDLKALALKICPDPSKYSQCAFDPDMADRIMKAVPCMSLPTHFESPLFFFLIDLITSDLDKIRVSHFPGSPITRFGSLPTGTFDAQAILPPGSKVPLVILNRDIFFFTGAFSKAVADSIPITTGKAVELDSSEEGIRRRLRNHPEIIHNFADAMSRLVQKGSSAGAVEVTLDEDHNHILARLETAMDEFLIAHEEAHVILGHVSDQFVEFHLAGSHSGKTSVKPQKLAASNSRILSLPSKGPTDGPLTTLKAEQRTRDQELKADAQGFRLMIWSEEEQGDPIALMMAAAAPSLVFRVLDAASAYGSEAGGWTFSDANHPSADERINSLSPVFDEVGRTSEFLREVDFRILFDTAFKVLLAEANPQIRQNLGLKVKDAK